MNKQAIILKHFQKIDQLTVSKEQYREVVKELCKWFLRSDMVQRDVTTKLLFSKIPTEITARIFGKEKMTIAGVEEVVYLLDTFTDIQSTVVTSDGKQIEKGQTILELRGNPSEILAYERTILNMLQRLSGIATATQSIVAKVSTLDVPNKPFIVSTRKTPWTVLDKKAVALGGGGTHRLNLGDGVLVKDNHLLILKELYKLNSEPELVVKTFSLLEEHTKNMLIEIELEEMKSLEAVISAACENGSKNTLSILLDNFTPNEVKENLSALQKKYDLSSVIFEAAGGITAETITEWAATGVDVISLGSLTHSTKAVDISLEIS